MIEYASGGPTGYLFRAKARGLRTETWKRGPHTFDCLPPPMPPLPVMALRLLLSIALSPRLAAGGYHGAMKRQKDFGREVPNRRLINRLNHEIRNRIFHLRNPVPRSKIGGRRIERINNWKSVDYEIIVYYLKLQSVELSIERVRLRVSQGGHDIPEHVIRRRYERSWINFQRIYKHLADSWTILDNSGNAPQMTEESEDR